MKKLLFYILFFSGLDLRAQQWSVAEMAPMPIPVSNNALTEGIVAGVPYVLSFGGIDSTKIFSGITLNSFRYNTQTDVWEQIPDLPDTLGKIASAASNVKNLIYIIGGYHVLSSGNETSSNKVHVYDPESNSFMSDAADIPMPVDDQVQCVWRDSLIYVITGWSNTTNISNVQVFNPSSNIWSAGTAVPNAIIYKAFGASGVIVGDTIYYYGGASTALDFPAQKQLRTGIINPANPLDIAWSSPSSYQNDYRCAATSDSLGNVYFLGGSPMTYNYNGIAYNGGAGVNPNTAYYYFNASNPITWDSLNAPLPMDLRGIANISGSIKYIAGGMDSGQVVSNKTLRLQLNSIAGVPYLNGENENVIIYPNPSKEWITVKVKPQLLSSTYSISDLTGRIVLTGSLRPSVSYINIGKLSTGLYIFRLNEQPLSVYKLLKM